MADAIQTVHLVFKTHLDVGFTDFARTVTTSYFEDYIPSAIQLAQKLRCENKAERFIWTTGSWLIYEYLESATPSQKKLLEDAILAGDIVWHGLPFTTHTELMDASLFQYGLSLSQSLDKRFGRKTVAAKMTDVPGHTRGIVPLLTEAGIQFFHMGANAASTPPDVPTTFCWQVGDDDLMVMYQKGGYGDLITVPGLPDALAFAHTNDNHGPQTAESVTQIFREMREKFPEATIIASTMDAFAEKLLAIKAQLPVITAELGDTWIHGVGTDPTKVSQYRELLRLRKYWLDEGKIKTDNRAFSDFSRWLMLIPEHTWGMDEKTHLKDYTNYNAEHFKAARKTSTFQKFESSWAEQRAYLTTAVEQLKDTPLHQEALNHLASIKPVRPNFKGYKSIQTIDLEFETAYFKVGFDQQSGAITHLADKKSGRKWATSDHVLGLFQYETFSQADYDRFWKHYIVNKRTTKVWSLKDYAKIGMSEAAPESRFWTPQQTRFYERRIENAQTFLVHIQMNDEASTKYGCPRVVILEMIFPNESPEIQFNLQWFEKPACRLPEAMWFSFNPLVSEPQNWRMEKLGQWISPLEVIRNGNRKLHAVGSGIRNADRTGEITIETLDAPLIAPGEPSLLNFNNRQPPLKNGMHFNLYNNIWATNFPMWFEDDARFRFTLKPAF